MSPSPTFPAGRRPQLQVCPHPHLSWQRENKTHIRHVHRPWKVTLSPHAWWRKCWLCIGLQLLKRKHIGCQIRRCGMLSKTVLFYSWQGRSQGGAWGGWAPPQFFGRPPGFRAPEQGEKGPPFEKFWSAPLERHLAPPGRPVLATRLIPEHCALCAHIPSSTTNSSWTENFGWWSNFRRTWSKINLSYCKE